MAKYDHHGNEIPAPNFTREELEEKAHPWTKQFRKDKAVQAWLDSKNRDSPQCTKYSPSYWNDNKPYNDGLGWDDPETGQPGSLYRA